MAAYTTPLSALDKNCLLIAGGKAANLGELSRAGLDVPAGFCLTTKAFARFVEALPTADELYRDLDRLDPGDRDAAGGIGGRFRAQLAEVPVPEDVAWDLLRTWQDVNDGRSFAVRSSATAEDLPGASFAGQHDTFLNVRDEDQLLDAVRKCWLSLFSDRAIAYRARHGFDHRSAELAVVVQEMVEPTVSGVLFTADPVSAHRRTVVINAAYGLGETVVSGLVNPDLYRVGHDGRVDTSLGDKKIAVHSSRDGGVERRDVPEHERKARALTDAQIAELTAIGHRIQRHFGSPQDVEWAWADGRFVVLQSRPITSLYPLPDPPGDDRLHVYFSLGHQQMMTDAIKPMGLSVLRTFFPFGRREPTGESTQMVQAGGRLFFDYTNPLHSPVARKMLARAAGKMDQRVGRAVLEIAERPDFQAGHRFDLRRELAIDAVLARTFLRVLADVLWADMSTRQAKVQAFMDHTLDRSRARLATDGSAAETIERIQQELTEVPLQLFYRITLAQVSTMTARALLDRLCLSWLGDTDDLPPLDRSMPGNVTTEMGMAIGDLADLARGNPALLSFLQAPPRPFTWQALDAVPDSGPFGAALKDFLSRYGRRCPGELDITRIRWGEDPAQLFAGILSITRTGSPGEQRARWRAGEAAVRQATERILGRLRETGLGAPKAAAVGRLITVYRTMMGLREHQKFLTVGLFDGYRQVIREAAGALVAAGVLASLEDADFLSLDELRRLLDGDRMGDLATRLEQRRAEYEAWTALNPPRLFTSDGELLNGGAPGPRREGVLQGCPVSPGVAEGRARIVLRPQDAHLQDGDILVAPFTDPAWTPLFSAVRGMVLEVGGVMTHGAVVARELGLPTVVGVDDATRLIADGDYIRVDGALGTVARVPEPARPGPGRPPGQAAPGVVAPRGAGTAVALDVARG